MTTSTSRLFQPLQLGNASLEHRIAMAPLTRFRADDNNVPTPIMAEYYSQRASVPGTLLITEATYIAPEHTGYPNAPGIWNEDQVKAWRSVTSAVHAKGSSIFLQLWALGRAAGWLGFNDGNPPKYPVVAPTALAIDADSITPLEMSEAQIKETVRQYAAAAKNAIAAGFDGVEIHGANGYLVDQFIQSNTNHRTDSYGGSIAKRNRFPLEVAEAVIAAVGKERVGMRLSPFSTFQGMRMPDPAPQYSALLRRLNELELAYVHLIEGRVNGNVDVESQDSLDWAFANFSGKVLLAGGFTPERAKTTVEERADRDIVVVFGRSFIANPDLVFKIKEGLQLDKYDRSTFYTQKNPLGYADRPFSKEFKRWEAERMSVMP